jgi:hypothetical protein
MRYQKSEISESTSFLLLVYSTLACVPCTFPISIDLEEQEELCNSLPLIVYTMSKNASTTGPASSVSISELLRLPLDTRRGRYPIRPSLDSCRGKLTP